MTPQKVAYLAGGTSARWRRTVKRAWEPKGVRCVDPFRDLPQGCIGEFTQGDLEAIRGSTLVLGLLDYPQCYTGMALEFGYAHALAIPAVYVHAKGDRVDSMMAGVSSGVFTRLGSAMAFCERRFL